MGVFSTTNFQTFSELAFSFTLTGKIAAQSIVFAVVMGCWAASCPLRGRRG
jgi:hypothetical protein